MDVYDYVTKKTPLDDTGILHKTAGTVSIVI